MNISLKDQDYFSKTIFLKINSLLQNGLRRQTGAVDFEHALLEDEVFAPFLENLNIFWDKEEKNLQHIGLQRATHRTEVVQTRHTTVDRETLEKLG